MATEVWIALLVGLGSVCYGLGEALTLRDIKRRSNVDTESS